MSYWVSVEKPSCSHCGRDSDDVVSLSFGRVYSPVVNACLDAAGPAPMGPTGELEYSWWRLSALSAKEALPILEAAHMASRDAASESRFRALLDDGDPYVSLDRLRASLSELAAACRRNPDARLRVSG